MEALLQDPDESSLCRVLLWARIAPEKPPVEDVLPHVASTSVPVALMACAALSRYGDNLPPYRSGPQRRAWCRCPASV
ncbi:MAG TPA: hypothetical protein VK081_11895 [Planctomycetota bacterium]|nr:hypothetical protein [Planctomycetota bacterium]